MDFSQVASYFDETPCYDTATNDYVCDGQFDLFDDTKRDSTAADRRIFSIDPQYTLPKLLTIHGDVFIVGEGHKDYALGDVTRVKYVLHKAASALLSTVENLLGVGLGQQVYAGLVWVKNSKRESESSRLHADYQVILAAENADYVGSYVQAGAKTLAVQAQATTSAGFDTLECSDLGAPAVQTLSYTSQGASYNPVTDTFASIVPVLRQGIVSRYFADYSIVNQATPKAEATDVTIKVLAAIGFTPKEGDLIASVTTGLSYRVAAVRLGATNHTLQATLLWV